MVWPPLTRDDLRFQAGVAGFDTKFPLLIRRLIIETTVGLSELDFPGGSGTAAGDFDGIVTCSSATPLVPEGVSVWELSVGGGQSKADEDYEKRTVAPHGLRTQDVTYVQVLLAPWTKARTWVNGRRAEQRWKDVRGYNLDRVHVWLDSAPSTMAWLAEQQGHAVPDVRPADSWWTDTWLPSTSVAFDAEVVLAGRADAAEQLRQQLSDGTQVLTISGDLRPDDFRAFVAASLAAEGADGRPASSNFVRTLFVSSADALRTLAGQPGPLVLVITEPSLAAELPASHPHQLVMPGQPGATGTVQVPALHAPTLEAALKTRAIPRERAGTLAVLGRRSLLALRRTLAVNPSSMVPSWSVNPDAVRRRLLLIGSWDDSSDHDRRLVSKAVDLPYAEVQERALSMAGATELPYIGKVDDQWHVLSPEDAWLLLGGALTTDDLERFSTSALEVLQELDPSIDLSAADRLQPGVTASRSFSESLRNGVAQSLALLGSDVGSVRAGGRLGNEWARILLRELFETANADDSYQLWTSLRDVLSLLAEAAPREFLRAMADGLAGDHPLHAQMFRDGTRDGFGFPPVSPHTSFLWALECLAWSEEYCDDAVDIVARLAALDPGGHWSNRPAVTLATVLSAWCPNTTAPAPQRIRAITRIHAAHPAVGEQLLLDLIPDGNGFQTVHTGPRFRPWKAERQTSHSEIADVVTAVVELLLTNLNDDPAHYLHLIDKIDVISPDHRSRFTSHLERLGETLDDHDQRDDLFQALGRKLAHHREYLHSEWALPEPELEKLEAAAATLRPTDPVRRHSWLFASPWITLGDVARRDGHDLYDAAVAKRRRDAVAEILEHGGLPDVERLATGTAYPGLVGSALGVARAGSPPANADIDDAMLGWLTELSPRHEIAFSYFAGQMRTGPGELREELWRRPAGALARARMLRASFDPLWAWEQLDSIGDDEITHHYWLEFIYTGLGHDFPGALDAARKLISVGRNAAALQILVLYTRGKSTPAEAGVALDAVESLLATGFADPESASLSQHEFDQIAALLAAHRDEIGAHRVLLVEWQLFPAFGRTSAAPTLHATLANDPAFFVELICLAYRPASTEPGTETAADIPPDPEPDPDPAEQQRRSKAMRAFEVLHYWRHCPGLQPDGTLNRDELRSWVTSARQLLTKADRLTVGDSDIGSVLAHAPKDPNGDFPPLAVRDLLEELANEDIERGLAIGLYNLRGAFGRGLLEGGSQERDLAATYRQSAERFGEWRRTKRLLLDLAESYDREARREDDRAERRHHGLPD